MAWDNKGPWGGSGGSNNGGSQPQSPWGKDGREKREDFERIFRKGQDRVRSYLPGGWQSPQVILGGVFLLLLLWAATGFYRVNPGEQGIELLFGRFSHTTEPGLNWNWPSPVGAVETPDVSTRYRVEVGFRTGAGNADQDAPEESLMLTGDENIIDVQFVVLWRIKDPQKYLFEIRDPDTSVRNAVEAAMREIIGQNSFELARTQGRGQIETQAQELAQKILDSYSSGIAVEQVSMQRVDPPEDVIASFRDVQAARADKERLVNEAQAYYNQITQEAEGQAAQLVKQAEAYQQEKVAIAKGDTERFLAIFQEYKGQPELTRRRLYLETMEQIYQVMDKVIIDQPGSALPLLSVNDLLRAKQGAPSNGNRGANQGQGVGQ